jgi:hypothetical protein
MAFTHLRIGTIVLGAFIIMGVSITSMSDLERLCEDRMKEMQSNTAPIIQQQQSRLLPTRDNDNAVMPSLPILDFGNATTSIILDIGSSVDPIMPRKSDGPCAVAIAFEPIRPHQIATHPQLYVIPAAVTGRSGASLTKMFVYNGGISSSLSKVSLQADWNTGRKNDGQVKLVPTIPLQTILLAIHGPIDMIMTDMQGYDFDTAFSVGELFAQRNVKRLHMEVYLDDVMTYEGMNNDFCRDFLQHMDNVGYELEGVMDQKTHQTIQGYDTFQDATEMCKKQIERNGVERPLKLGLNEFDGLWRLKSEPRIENRTAAIDMYRYPNYADKRGKSLGTYHQFSDAEYSGCGL